MTSINTAAAPRGRFRLLRTAFAFVLLLIILVFSGRGITLGVDALKLCAGRIIPALFPAMVASRLLLSSLPASADRSGALAISMLTGMLCGFPVGAVSLSAARERDAFDTKVASDALPAASCTGPAFCCAVLGRSFLGSFAAGFFMWAAGCAFSLLLWFLFYVLPAYRKRRRFSAPDSPVSPAHAASPAFSEAIPLPCKPQRFADAFASSVSLSASACLSVCGCVVFFSVAGGILCDGLEAVGASPDICAFLMSLLEVGSGSARCAALASYARVPLCAFTVGFGGLSVYMQTLQCAKGLFVTGYIPFRLAVGACCALVFLLFPPF